MKPLRKFESAFDLLVVPSRCTAGLPSDLEKDHLVCEVKLDGSRYVLYLGYDPYSRRYGNTLLSRRISTVEFVRSTDGDAIYTHVDRTDNLPHITMRDYGLAGTILDGECFLTNFPTTSSIMGSNPRKAIAKQNDIGLITYYVWDIMAFKGKDIRGLPLSKRRKILIEVVKQMDNPHVKVVPQWSGDIEARFQQVTERGGEGLIVKDIRCGYGVGWCKFKKSTDVSCIVSGFKPGNGKYADTIGALALSVYKDGKLVEVGFASGFDDKTRYDIGNNPDQYLGCVVDVYAQEILKNGTRLRHPTFYRFRDDVEPETCTWDKLKTDFKKNIKGWRARG